jgi:outer membrane receptor protein involved in Fe transport
MAGKTSDRILRRTGLKAVGKDTGKYMLSNNALVYGMVGGAALAVSAPASAQTAQFHIPAQSVPRAIAAFGQQSGLQIIAPADLPDSVVSNAVSGSLDARAALRSLIAGTGLEIVSDKGNIIVLRKSPVGNRNQAAANDSSGDVGGDDIVVTGSRIERREFEASAPTAVTREADIRRTGESRIFDVLNELPQLGIGQGPINTNRAQGDLGGQFVNLRGLGTGRTLVLVDGQRRVSGSTTSSALDLSTIPSNLVERVEIVTGGAAAVYGADAVSGVVNILLKKQVNGVELNVRQGLSSRGDTASSSIGAIFGGALGDRGRFTIGGSFNHDAPVKKADRPFSESAYLSVPNPANTGPNDGIYDFFSLPGFREPLLSYGGTFTIDGTRYTFDRSLRPTSNGGLAYDGDYGYGGGDGQNRAEFGYLIPKITTGALLATASYDVTDNIKLSSQFDFSRTKTKDGLPPNNSGSGSYTIYHQPGHDNPLIPADVLALMDANSLTTLSVTRSNRDSGPVSRDVTRTSYTGILGLDGSIGARLNWRVFGQYGRFRAGDNISNTQILSRFKEAIDVIAGPIGPQCASAAARAAGCLPLNIFGPNAATPEAVAYFSHDATWVTTNEQKVAGAQLSGDLIDLPAGPLSFASGIEYRKDSIESRPDVLAAANQLYLYSGAKRDGSISASEAFGEVSIPLLKHLPFADYLEVNGAARYSHYSTSGGTVTWKVGAVYAPIPDIRLRVTRSRSVRAPNLIELFSPGSRSTAYLFDPCHSLYINQNPNRAKNCAALGIPAGWNDPLYSSNRTIITTGNDQLQPETSNSLTVGAVIQPRAIPNLSLSVDYYDIKIDGAVASLSLVNILNGCVDKASLDTLLCSQIVRQPGGSIDSVYVQPVNFSQLTARGVDVTLRYRTDVGSLWGERVALGVIAQGSYTTKNELVSDPSKPEQITKLLGQFDIPQIVANVTLTGKIGSIETNWTARFFDRTKLSNTSNNDYADAYVMPSLVYHDVYLTTPINKSVEMGVGVKNLFDKLPEVRNEFRGRFDIYGRRFFIDARYRF